MCPAGEPGTAVEQHKPSFSDRGGDRTGEQGGLCVSSRNALLVVMCAGTRQDGFLGNGTANYCFLFLETTSEQLRVVLVLDVLSCAEIVGKSWEHEL